MPKYRRDYLPEHPIFLTWVTYRRAPLLAKPDNISLLRQAVKQTQIEAHFNSIAAFVLPDRLHFIWILPSNDTHYSKRVGRIKVLFTRVLRGQNTQPADLTPSRRQHRESHVWQRRFWEHTLCREAELSHYVDYVHHNPVKHGLVRCPHVWPYSSFHDWVKRSHYPMNWACSCADERREMKGLFDVAKYAGE